MIILFVIFYKIFQYNVNNVNKQWIMKNIKIIFVMFVLYVKNLR